MARKKRLRLAFDVDTYWWKQIRAEARKSYMDVSSYLRMITYRETRRRRKYPVQGGGPFE